MAASMAGTPADTARLRLHQLQHDLYRDGGINGGAPRLEHLVTGIGGQGVSRRYGKALCLPAGLFRITGGRLGRNGRQVVVKADLGSSEQRHAQEAYGSSGKPPAAVTAS